MSTTRSTRSSRRASSSDNRPGEDIDEPADKDTGAWYEKGKAAVVLNISEEELDRKCLNPRVRVETGSSCKAPPPYDGLTFVFVADVGGSGSVTKVSLPEFGRLCNALDVVQKSDYAEELSPDNAKLFRRYTKSDPNGDVIKRWIKNGYFILPDEVKQIQAARKEENKSKKGSDSSKGDGNSSGSKSSSSGGRNAGNSWGAKSSSSGGRNADGNASGRGATGLGKKITARRSSGVEEKEAAKDTPGSGDSVCVGLCSARVNEKGKTNPLYCLEKFDFSRESWRSKGCLLERRKKQSTTGDNESRGEDDWKQITEGLQCKKCATAKGNIRPDRYSPLYETNTSSATGSVAPDSDEVKQRICSLYDAHWKEGNDKDGLVFNREAKELMAILRLRGIYNVDCNDGNQVFICRCLDGQDSICDAISVVQKRSNNAGVCFACYETKKSNARSDRNRLENYCKQIDPKSTTNFRFLTEEQVSERVKLLNIERKAMRSKVKRMKETIAKSRMVAEGKKDKDGIFAPDHQDFRSALEEIGSLAGGERKQDFRRHMKEQLLELLQEENKVEQGDPNAKINPEQLKQVDGVLDFVAKELGNTVKKINGKDKQVEFSPTCIQMAMCEFNRSQAGYRENKALSPLNKPSISTLKKLRSAFKVNDGECPKFYESRRLQRVVSTSLFLQQGMPG